MAEIFAFNGDADGLCALQQLRLAEAPAGARLVTGVKRDIGLLARIDAGPGDRVTVLDVSHDHNRADVARLLAAGAELRYFDHHFAGEPTEHARFHSYIDTSAEVCTSVLVDRYLDGKHVRWAIAAAFGDEMPRLGQALASQYGLQTEQTEQLAQLGRCLNYNGYGESLADLHFDPARLAEALLPFADPFDFLRDSPIFAKLEQGYRADMELAAALTPIWQAPGAIVLLLPDAPWARRVNGVLANQWMRGHPGQALAVVVPKTSGAYMVSVRVPDGRALGADEFCGRYPSGGGRKRAGGINGLPADGLEDFIAAFGTAFAA
jgi:hypothetical protein